MYRPKVLTLLSIILLFTVLGMRLATATSLVVNTPTQAELLPNTTLVYASPLTITVTTGETITVKIRVENVVGLYAWSIGMWWNPNALECVKFEEGPFLKTGGTTLPVSGTINNAEGKIDPPYGCTLAGAMVGVDGSGTLANLTFRAKTSGTFNVHPLNIALSDIDGGSIPTSVADVFTVVSNGEIYPIVTMHNLTSGISDYAFNESLKEISFDVAGEGSSGFCNVTIPKVLITANVINPWKVLLDGEEIAYEKAENATHTSLYFTFTLSTHRVQIRGAGAEMYPDVSVTSVTASSTEVLAGEPVIVNVAVKNKGAGNQTFQVTAYYGNTPIETQTVTNLTEGASETLTFPWNTTAVAPGVYTIKAVASTVAGEIATGDNTLEDGAVSIIETTPQPPPKPTVYVDGSNIGDPLENGSLVHPFDKIQEGINAANAGDIVHVASGTYYEHIIVNKSLTLLGENRNTVIDGNGIWVIIQITADNVKISGFTIANGLVWVSGKGQFYGIWVYKPDGSTTKGTIISGNTIVNNSVGVMLNHASGSIISGNTIINNFYGIWLQSSSDNIISDNTVILSWTCGIRLSLSHRNLIVGNTLFYNLIANAYGVGVGFGSSNNTLYHNNFVNNKNQAFDAGTNTMWDNGAEGNYWSDYNGTDLNKDGIGDTPYVIEPNGLDRYPLMHPHPAILIDQSYVSDNRCDVGSIQTVGFHAKWAHDNSNVAGACIYVNETKYVTDQTGWIRFNVADNTVGKRLWTVTGVSLNGITAFKQIINASFIIWKQAVDNPSIIWDRIYFTLNAADDRINVGSNASISWSGTYEYDGAPFIGSISFNDTTLKDSIGKYGYTVQSISDSRYGLTDFTSNSVPVIFDRVNVALSIGDSRIDVGTNATITWNGAYEYDGAPFGGSITLNNTQTQYDTVGRRCYTVDAIDDPLYGITVFTSNSVNCIWDRVDITLSADDDRINVGSRGSYSLVAVYAYDGERMCSCNLSVTLNDTLTKVDVGKYGYTISSISERQYGLTRFTSNSFSIIFDRVIITLSVEDSRIGVGATASIVRSATYEYDGSAFVGTIILNDTQLTKNEAGKYGYTVASISGGTQGITAFESNSVYVTFEKAAGPSPVPLEGFPWWIVGILAAAILAVAAVYLWKKKKKPSTI